MSDQLTFEQSGTHRRDRGIARLEDREESKEWLRGARIYVSWLRSAPRNFTAEDVRAQMGDPPSPNLMGALFNDPESLGIEFVRWVPSTRPEAHSRPLRSWRGKK